MRRVASVGIALLALLLGAATQAQSPEDMQRCRAISDDAKRLDCYDAIEFASGPRPKYEVVDLSDLKSYALSYRGQLIEVSGWIKPSDNLFLLGKDAADVRPIPVDFDALGRRDRQEFLRACSDGCEATVQGRVTPVNFTTGIVADALIAH